MTLDILSIVVISLATWRLAFLMARENAPFQLMARLRKRTTLGGLLNCLYCSSWWAALVMLALWMVGAQLVVYVFAVSGLALMAGNWTGVNQG